MHNGSGAARRTASLLGRSGARALLAAVGLVSLAYRSSAAEPAAPAFEVTVDPEQVEIQVGTSLTFQFPDTMAGPEEIGGPPSKPVLRIEPPLETEARWQSPTELRLRVQGGVRPGTGYRIALSEEALAAVGTAADARRWEVRYRSRPLLVSRSDTWGESDSERYSRTLAREPSIPLRATYPIRFADVAERIVFRTADGGQRRGVTVLVSGSEAAGTFFTVQAREPLPVGHQWDLVIEGLRDAATDTPLPHPIVLPAGTTRALEVRWLGGFNHPLAKPEIRAEFNEPLLAETVGPDTVSVEPPVPGFKVRADGRQLVIEGEFDRTVRRVVRIGTGVRGVSGFGLAQESRWGATFRSKRPNVLFPPSSEAFFPAEAGMRFPLIQVNAPELRWRLAEVPLEKLGLLRRRLLEFREDGRDPLTGEAVRDARTGWWCQKPTELFVDSLGLRVVAQAALPASAGDEEVDRMLEWRPEGPARGAHLIEVEGTLPDGSVIGNRALVFFSDLVVNEVSSADRYAVRVVRMADGEPVRGATVRMFSGDPIELGRAVADETGLATFPDPNRFFDSSKRPSGVGRGEWLVVESAGGRIVEPVQLGYGSYRTGPEREFRTVIVSDRNVYRPGHTVKLYGIVRMAEDDALRLPKVRRIQWLVQTAESDEEVASGEAVLSPAGGWQAEWQIPEGIATGLHQVRCRVAGEDDWAGVAMLQIQEYRPPLFTVSASAARRPVGDVSKMRVESRYFHGAPNAGATVRWRAVWRWIDPEDRYDVWEEEGESDAVEEASPGPNPLDFTRTDRESEGAKEPEVFAEVSGEAKLDGSGVAEISSNAPFRDGLGRSRCRVQWTLDVLSPDGQTLTEKVDQEVQLPALLTALRAAEGFGANRGIAVEWGMFDAEDRLQPGAPARLEVYAVSTKAAKEQVAPFVFRYQNWPVYEKVLTREVRSAGEVATERVPLDRAGDYVVVLVPTDPAQAIRASTRVTVSGQEPVEFPVADERGFELDAGPKRAWKPGETAVLTTRAPFAGLAWVLVHTDRVLDAFTVRLDGNAGRIEIPIRPEYAPNIAVSVHLLRPSDGKRPPAERIARARLEVARPDRVLTVRADPIAAKVEPGKPVEGLVRVACEGKPVKGAELAVFAVDEAVLSLGQWEEPDLVRALFRERSGYLSIGMGLGRYAWQPGARERFEKGFIIGGGGLGLKGLAPKYARKEFKPLAYWNALVRTGADGTFRYRFDAPDNLTTYRIVAVAQTADHRFGAGSSKVEVSKPLMIEPALPRFVREEDRFQIRAVVRHTGPEPLLLKVRCTARGVTVEGGPEREVRAAPGEPQVVTFEARVPRLAAGAREAVIALDCRPATAGLSPDAAEVRIPIEPRAVLRRETRMLTHTGPRFEPGANLPAAWKGAEGEFDLVLSSSPWIAKLEGLPLVLEYPHGCFEQTASRYLACSFLAELLAYLPEAADRKRNYERLLQVGMRAWEESLLSDGTLPMWRGGSRTSPFVTVMAAWAVHEAGAAGWAVPETLSVRIENGLDTVLRGRLQNGWAVPLGTRAFALMVLGLRGGDGQAYQALAEELYLKRDAMGDEGRGFLAAGLARLGILPERLQQLAAELGAPVVERAFDPDTFTSTTRAEAIQILALAEAVPGFWKSERAGPMRDRLLALLDSSAALSTQENLWLLVAFKSMHRAGGHGSIGPAAIRPKADAVSKNGASAGWNDRDIAKLEAFVVQGLPARTELTALVRGRFRETSAETARDRRGIAIERVVTNLTDPARVGTAAQPVRIGDRILVTWRVRSERLHHYVALEDLLPAGLETVNPDLALIAKTFEIPGPAAGERLLSRSHQELRDAVTNLYFDELRPGAGVYSVLARATAVGTFAWPAAQVTPMYDARFGGLSPAGVFHVVE